MSFGGIRKASVEEEDMRLKPLVVGWVPSPAKMDMMSEGREKELPGHWLYALQSKYHGKIGRLCGWLFGIIYANRAVGKRKRT